MRRPLIAANWKMNKTIGETETFLFEFIPMVRDVKDADIVVAPPFTSLHSASLLLKNTNVALSSQDLFFEDKGAFTGEVSSVMLTDVGCSYAIVGHSERRQYFKESNEIINRKVVASRKHSLNVIFCIGETLQEREAAKTFEILAQEVAAGLRDVPSEGISVAYEPIWAIGTGKTATPEQAQEAHHYIRERLSLCYGNAAQGIRILYGGSVTPENIDVLMACEDVDGALVGGASLKADSFAKIVNYKR